jgi:hypothetical protein
MIITSALVLVLISLVLLIIAPNNKEVLVPAKVKS